MLCIWVVLINMASDLYSGGSRYTHLRILKWDASCNGQMWTSNPPAKLLCQRQYLMSLEYSSIFSNKARTILD